MRGTHLQVSEKKKIWVFFRYERLANFCFWCGKIGHSEWECEEAIGEKDKGSGSRKQYGAWLRADPLRKTSFMGGRRESSEGTGGKESVPRAEKGWLRERDDPGGQEGESRLSSKVGEREEENRQKLLTMKEISPIKEREADKEQQNHEGAVDGTGVGETMSSPIEVNLHDKGKGNSETLPQQCLALINEGTMLERGADIVDLPVEREKNIVEMDMEETRLVEVEKQQGKSWKRRARKSGHGVILSPKKMLLSPGKRHARKREYLGNTSEIRDGGLQKRLKFSSQMEMFPFIETNNKAEDGEVAHPHLTS